MKRICIWFCMMISVAFLLPACNGSAEKTTEKTTTTITEIPASSSSPEAVKAFNEGLAYADDGDRLKAREAFATAISLDPNLGIAYIMRANTATTAKEFADDINTGKSKMDSASDWEKSYAEYLSTNLVGNRSQQLAIAKQMAEAYPNAARAQVILGDAYSGNKEYDKSRESYEKAIKLKPDWIGGYSGLANSYLFEQPLDLKKAEENAKKVVELRPNSAGAQIILGDVYRAQNDLQKAKTAYEKAVSLDSTNSAGYYKLGHANTYLGNLEEARKNYADGGNHDTRKTGANLNTAFTYLYGNNPKEALQFLSKQLENNPALDASEKNTYLNTMATIAVHTGNAAALKAAMDKMPETAAQFSKDLGNTPEIQAFNKADSLHWLAMLNITEGKYDQAKMNLEAMKTALDPIQDSRKLEQYEADQGLLSMKQKNYADAVSHFEKGNPNDIYIKYMQAKANEAAGNKEKADTLYKEVAAYNFNDVGNALIRTEIAQHTMPKN